jgi:hypothetical protein
MAVTKSRNNKKYFTVAEANATLPLVRAIVRDIARLAHDLRERQVRLAGIQRPRGALDKAYQEELEQAQTDFERDHERLLEYEQELRRLGIELKDYEAGLVDFPCWMDNREVYLCWRIGEPDVAHWHELKAGFAGRQKLVTHAGTN